MPEIDLRKLREMQLAQNQNHEMEENSSHDTWSIWSEVNNGIVDLWVSPLAVVGNSEVLPTQKPIKKDVWIDIPHERVIDTPQDTWVIKAKPIKISFSSLSQHQKQKDPERLYQEKEAAIGKLFGDGTAEETSKETVNVAPNDTPNVQKIPDKIEIPEVLWMGNVPDSHETHEATEIIGISNQVDISTNSQENAAATPEVESQSIESVNSKDEIVPVANTITLQNENIQEQPSEQQEYSIEDVSEHGIQISKDDALSLGWVATSQAGFFPELSFITPVSIPKEDNTIVQDSTLPREESEIISHTTQSEEIVLSNTEESQQAWVVWDDSMNSMPTSDSTQDTPSIGAWVAVPDMVASIASSASVSTEVQQTPIEIISPTEAPLPEGPTNLHETNKKSLRWVIFWVIVMMVTLSWAGTYLWQNQKNDIIPSSNGSQDNSIASITDLEKNNFPGSASTGMISTGNTLTGSVSNTWSFTLTGSTGSGLVVGTGFTNTSSGSFSLSWTVSWTGTILSGSLSQSGWVKLPLGTGATAVTNTGSLTSNTSTGKVVASTGSIAPKPNASTGSLVVPNTTPPKYLEGRDYKVYGGGYKLVRTVKKK
jgi:hypothetical protein